MPDATVVAWRVFPWDPAAPVGAPFSPGYVHPNQGSGRFDLAGDPLVLYLAETPAHAIGEALQSFRGRTIGPAHLRRHGHVLALVEVHMPADVRDAVADLTIPSILDRLALRPDALASHDRRRTQAAARAIYAAGYVGLRWWSALTGEWHGLVLFLDRIRTGDLRYGTPTLLTSVMKELREAAELLGIRIAGVPPRTLGSP